VEAGQGLLRVPQEPEGHRGNDAAGQTWILANAEYHQTALVWRVAGAAVLQVLAGGRQRAKPEQCIPKGIVGGDSERGVVGALRQAQQRCPELSRRAQLRPYDIKSPQAIQDLGKLWRLADLLTQRVCLGVGANLAMTSVTPVCTLADLTAR